MGAVNFSLDLDLVKKLKSVFPLDIFVETGTFEGDTIENVKNLFSEIHTVELSKEYYNKSKKRFQSEKTIHLYLDSSEKFLKKIHPILKNKSVLYWLDAHWCVADKTAGVESQCPLLEELASIKSLNNKSVIIIDDARLFIAPPPYPHEISHWPDFNLILSLFRKLSTVHETIILNDTIIYYPRTIRETIKNYAHESSIDWLTVLDKSRDYDTLLRQQEKMLKQMQKQNNQIFVLSKDLVIKDKAINDKENSITLLSKELIDKEKELDNLFREIKDKDEKIVLLSDDLVGKQNVMNSLINELKEKDGKINVLSNDLVGKQDEINSLTNGLKAKDEKINVLSHDLVAKKKEIDSLSNGLKAKDVKINVLSHDLVSKQNEIDSLSNGLKAKDVKINVFSHDLVTKQNEIDSLTNELKAKDEKINVLSHDLVTKKNEIDSLTNELKAKDEKINVLSDDLIDVDMVISLYSDLVKKEKEINFLSESLTILKKRLSTPIWGLITLFQFHFPQLWDYLYRKNVSRIEKKSANKRKLEIKKIAVQNQNEDVVFTNKQKVQKIKVSKKNKLSFFTPRLGKLNHYEPTELLFPKNYFNTSITGKTPRLSIVTPSFNQAVFLERTMKSVLDQNYPDLEYIVQDGGSTDGSVEIINKYKKYLKSSNSMKDNGQADAINKGFSKSSGEIMAWLNSDDIYLPGTLNFVASYFNRNPRVDVVYGHRILINNEDKEIGRWILPPHDKKVLMWADFIPQETLFWRRKIWEKSGSNLNTEFNFALDWDLLLRFQESGAIIKRLPRFLGAFRVHLQQKTSVQISSVGEQEMKILREKYIGRNVSYSEINKNIFNYLAKSEIYNKLYQTGILRN